MYNVGIIESKHTVDEDDVSDDYMLSTLQMVFFTAKTLKTELCNFIYKDLLKTFYL